LNPPCTFAYRSRAAAHGYEQGILSTMSGKIASMAERMLL
jgi:hypothetical protein